VSESLQRPVHESYEGLRESVENTEAKAAWKDADRRREHLSQTYRTLSEDPRFTSEHKASQLWEAYEEQSAHIQAAGEKARSLLEKEAKGHEMMSVPRPKGENIFNLSAERLLASQNEAGRIVRKMQRLQDASSAGPFKPNTADLLREEYARGIEAGGIEGVAICKGALMAADELGISEDAFLNDLRTPEQLAMLERAERARRMAFSIPTSIPEPPLKRPREQPASGSPTKLFIPRDRPAHTKKPPPSWLRR
jgi:hypothetical protein